MFLFRSNHELHMKFAVIASILVLAVSSVTLIGTVVIGYISVWLKMPFSMPLSLSATVMIIIALIPALVGAPMLIYLKRNPPDKWMNSRKARLSI